MRVLLVGPPRSGTTWVLNVLGLAAHTRPVNEPDGPISDVLGAVAVARLGPHPVLTAASRPRWYHDVWDLAFKGGWPWDRSPSARSAGRGLVKMPRGLRDPLIVLLARVVGRLRTPPDNVVVKSVDCIMAMEWIVAHYQPKVVVVRRDPLNIISSWFVLDWQGIPSLQESRLVSDRYIKPLGLPVLAADSSRLAQIAWTVGLMLTVLRLEAADHPEWIVETHEELASDSHSSFASLYERLGLRWTTETEAYLARSRERGFVVHTGNPDKHPNAVTTRDGSTGARGGREVSDQWRSRLSPEQVDEACSVLQGFPLQEWGPRL